MRPIDNIRKSFRKLHIPTSTRLDERIHDEIARVSADKNRNKPAGPVLWRIIMKSNISKIAAAAVIIIAAVLSISLFNKTGSVAYSVEQTIEAMRNITSVHFFINTFTGDRIECWLKVNPETGENEKFYLDGPEFKGGGTLNDSYMYMKKTNTVTHMTRPSHIIQFGQFIEEMVNVAKTVNGTIQTKSEKSKGGKSVILLIIETDDYKIESRVNPVTKLPISMQLIPKKELNPEELGQNMEDFTFNEPLPEGIFDFEIPEGAEVIEQ